MTKQEHQTGYNPVARVGVVVSALAILPFPGELYSIVRIIICGAAGLIALKHYTENHPIWVLFFVVSLIFNPILPVYFNNKPLWIIIDILTGLLFYTQINNTDNFFYPKTTKDQESHKLIQNNSQKQNSEQYLPKPLPSKNEFQGFLNKIDDHSSNKKSINTQVLGSTPEDLADFFIKVASPIIAEWQDSNTRKTNIESAYFKGFLFGFLGTVTLYLKKNEPLGQGIIALRFLDRIDKALNTDFGSYIRYPHKAKNVVFEGDYIQAQEDVAIWSRCLLGMNFEKSSAAIIASSKRLSDLEKIDLQTAIFINTFCKHFRTKL